MNSTGHAKPPKYEVRWAGDGPNLVTREDGPGLSRILNVAPPASLGEVVMRHIGAMNGARLLMLSRGEDVATYEVSTSGQRVDSMGRLEGAAESVLQILNAPHDRAYTQVLYPEAATRG